MVLAIRVATAAMSAANVERQIQTCPATPVCPANDGCTWTDSTNKGTFMVECATDLYGSDFQTDQQAASYADCLHTCSITQGCVAISYTNQFCYLKNSVPQAVSNTLVAAATLIGSPQATPTPSATAFCSGTTVTCPAFNNCIYPAGASGLRQKPFVIACGYDYYGGDMSYVAARDAAICLNACALQGNCVAISYVETTQTCYLKNNLQSGVTNPNVIGPGSGQDTQVEWIII